MSFAEYSNYDGLGLAELVRKGEVTPAELVEAAIERIERHNSILNAVVFKAYDQARQRAATRLSGPFAGVPFLLKDLGAQKKGWPTRLGSNLTPEIPSDHDSTLVTRYEAAGAVALGKTNVPEFGIMATTEPDFYGPTRNPWNPDHSPGGSSGGSAAAVAAGIVPLAHGNDGGGSIRIPASCCGLVGLKPTRARTPAGPDVGDIMGGLVIDHVISRSVRDTAAMLDATAGPDLGNPYCAPPPAGSFLAATRTAPRQLRIAFAVRDLFGHPLHPDCRDAVERAAKLCASLGHEVEEGSPAADYRSISRAFDPIWRSGHAIIIGQAALASKGRPPLREELQGLVWAVYEAGLNVKATEYQNAWNVLHAASRKIAEWHRQHDIWLTPTLAEPPWKIGFFNTSTSDLRAFRPMAKYASFTPIQNMSGQPAINLPLHWSDAGLPIGAQFVGRFGEEE